MHFAVIFLYPMTIFFLLDVLQTEDYDGVAVSFHRFYDAYASRFNVYYEPEIFPALKLTLTNPKLTMQVFSNGTVRSLCMCGCFRHKHPEAEIRM